ncbi:peptidylprolyl isomerase [Ranunculus cassubicifolius]
MYYSLVLSAAAALHCTAVLCRVLLFCGGADLLLCWVECCCTDVLLTMANGLVVQELKMGKPDAKRANPGNKVFVCYIGKLKKVKYLTLVLTEGSVPVPSRCWTSKGSGCQITHQVAQT